VSFVDFTAAHSFNVWPRILQAIYCYGVNYSTPVMIMIMLHRLSTDCVNNTKRQKVDKFGIECA